MFPARNESNTYNVVSLKIFKFNNYVHSVALFLVMPNIALSQPGMYVCNVLNDQVIPSIDFFFHDGLGIFQDDNAKIHLALVVKEWSMRTCECQEAWGVRFTHGLATTKPWLYPIKSLWDVLEKTEGMVWPSCHQYKISAKNVCNSGWKYILCHCIRLSKQYHSKCTP